MVDDHWITLSVLIHTRSCMGIQGFWGELGQESRSGTPDGSESRSSIWSYIHHIYTFLERIIIREYIFVIMIEIVKPNLAAVGLFRISFFDSWYVNEVVACHLNTEARTAVYRPR